MTTAITRNLGPDTKELWAVVDRLQHTKKPLPQDVAALRALLAQTPGIYRYFVDVAEFATEGLIKAMAGDSVIVAESLKRGQVELAQSLGYDTATGLECLLIGTVALCYLRYTDSERRYSQLIQGGDVSIAQADRWDRRLEAEQKRYMRAVLTLARVRRLMQPVVAQVNIGGQQVNVAQVAK
jgi:hypothetical protein